MQHDLALSYASAGGLNTANALGYLLGALTSGRIMTRIGVVAVFGGSMLITAVALILTGFTGDYRALVFLRLVAGVTSALTFVAGGTLTSSLAGRKQAKAGQILGIYYAGAGLGVIASGVLLPIWLSSHLPDGWRSAWVILGALSFAASIGTAISARRVGYQAPPSSARTKPRLAILRPTLVAHFMFAFGYIAYMTFIIAYLRGFNRTAVEVSGFWVLLGVAVIAGAFVWGNLIGSRRDGSALFSILICVALGSVLPLLSTNIVFLALSACLFGLGALSEIAAITGLIRSSLTPAEWPRAIATSVTIFALGQSIGPIVTGWVSDRYRGLSAALLLSTVAILIGAAAARGQKPPVVQPKPASSEV
jgi:predicted MFS family arabinose efflux permease